MHICEISIKDFRAIRDLQQLHVHDFTSIVGKNDCGKSSVLFALRAFFDKKLEQQDFCTIGECAKELWVQLAFDQLPQELAEQLAAEQALDETGRVTLRRTFVAGEKIKDTLDIVCRDYVHEDFSNLPARTENELNKLIEDDYDLEPVGRSGARRTNEERWQRLWDYAEQNRLEMDPESLRQPHKDTLTLINKYLPIFYFFQSEQSLDTTASPFQRDFKGLIIEAVQAMEEVERIKDAGRDAVEEEVNAIEAILLQQTSQITALTAEIDFQPEVATTVVLNVGDASGVTNPLESRGLGIQRLAVVAFLKRRQQRAVEVADSGTQDSEDVLQPPKRVLYAIEEPETYLHPAAQRDFFYDLKNLSSAQGPVRYQVIASTHSTVFVDRMRPHEVVLLTRDHQGVANARQVEGDELGAIVKEELGLRNSDYFFANCLLCFEGYTEEAALPVFAEMLHGRTLDEMGVQPVNLHGVKNARMFLKAVKEVGVPALLLTDADANDTDGSRRFQPAQLIAEGLINEDDAFMYSEGDFEYQFSDEILVQAINHAVGDGYEFKLNEIADARSAAEPNKKLGNEIENICRARHSRLSKPELGRSIASRCESQDIPQTIRDFIAKATLYSDMQR